MIILKLGNKFSFEFFLISISKPMENHSSIMPILYVTQIALITGTWSVYSPLSNNSFFGWLFNLE